MSTDTISGHHAPGERGETFHLRSEAERKRAFVRAARHSKAVRVLRIALPVVAVVFVAGYFISSSMSVTVGDVTASIDGVELTDGNLRMTNPTLRGVDKENGNYVISAAYADQAVADANLIELHDIKAEVTNRDDGWSRLNAVRGTFDRESEKLVMKERISVETSSGIKGRLTKAEIDMGSQVIHSPEPVTFQMETGTVRAKTLTFQSAKSELTFEGDVQVHLVPKAKPPAANERSSAPTPPNPTKKVSRQ